MQKALVTGGAGFIGSNFILNYIYFRLESFQQEFSSYIRRVIKIKKKWIVSCY